ncbi:MAG: response regulator [Chloroflexi bacterium]|nr:response regulator [Chloroflexota bacterium]
MGACIHILLVEDDAIDAEAFIRAFRRQNLTNQITHVLDGIEALAVLRGEDGKLPLARPYIILLDINMPRMNGLEFLSVLRQDPGLRRNVVFMLTTSARLEDRQKAYYEQVAGYILKDHIGPDFLPMIQMFEQYQLMVQLPT